jgi:3-isopropylmalate dehydrogenase
MVSLSPSAVWPIADRGTDVFSGSAPDIAGQNKVNPIGTILSVAMMLRFSLNLSKEADAVEAAVKKAIDSGLRTSDLKGEATTSEMGDAIVKELVAILTS